jgi:hypothetical protein
VGDLWDMSKADRAIAAQIVARRMGTNVSSMFPLSTGLWMNWRDTSGNIHMTTEAEAKQVLLDVHRTQLRGLIEAGQHSAAQTYARQHRMAYQYYLNEFTSR